MEQQKPKWKTWHKVVITVCLLGAIGIFFGDKKVSDDIDKKEQAALTPQQKDSIERRKTIEKAFSSWDGSQNNLVKYVKGRMNDPESFKHVETSFLDAGPNSIVVMMTYRGKNAFGGVVTESIKAETALDGTIIKVFE